jgi:hypothetical protein
VTVAEARVDAQRHPVRSGCIRSESPPLLAELLQHVLASEVHRATEFGDERQRRAIEEVGRETRLVRRETREQRALEFALRDAVDPRSGCAHRTQEGERWVGLHRVAHDVEGGEVCHALRQLVEALHEERRSVFADQFHEERVVEGAIHRGVRSSASRKTRASVSRSAGVCAALTAKRR